MANITTDNGFSLIQRRSIDPYSNVYSDVTSRVTKILGTDNAYVSGFDLIGYDSDKDNGCITVTIGPGIGVISNIVIEITDQCTVNLVNYPIEAMKNYCVVLEYIYQKTTPVPIAVIKSILESDYNKSSQLILWKFKVQGYDTWVNNAALASWFSSTNGTIIDERHKTGYLPRVGGNVYGKISLSEQPSSYNDNDFVTKKWVESLVKSLVGSLTEISPDGSGGGILSNYIQKSGATVNGSIIQSKNPLEPIYDYEFITKKYVFNNYLSKSGGQLVGELVLASDPEKPLHAATKNYVDTKLDGIEGSVAKRINATFSHKNLQDLKSDDHPQYMLTSGARAFNGPVYYDDSVEIIKQNQLIPKYYVDNIANDLDIAIKNAESKLSSSATGGNSAIITMLEDHISPAAEDPHAIYIKQDGSKSFSDVVRGKTPTNESKDFLALTTREYVDTKIANLTPDNLGVISHTKLADKDKDDHPQYMLADGSREFTGPVIVPDIPDSVPNRNDYAASRGWITKYVEDKFAATITTLPSGVFYVKTDGSGLNVNGIPYTFDSEITTTTNAVRDYGVTTLGQVKEMFTKIKHENILSRDDVNAHPQYLLKTGGTLTGNLILPKVIVDTDPDFNQYAAIPYIQYKSVIDQVYNAVNSVNTVRTDVEAQLNGVENKFKWKIG